MNPPEQKILKTGSQGDLAFALVVGASYMAMVTTAFSSFTPVRILTIVFFGVIYLMLGIYGYGRCIQVGSPQLIVMYFVIQIPLCAVIIGLSNGASYSSLLMLPLAGHAVVLLDRKKMYAVSGAIALAYYAAVYFSTGSLQILWDNSISFFAGLIFVLVLTQMAVSEEHGRIEMERLAHQLEDANHQLSEYAVQVEELAISKERNRLAREIHDGLGHYLTAIYMQLQAARATLEADPVRSLESMTNAQNLTQEALADVRKSVGALRSLPSDNRSLHELLNSLLAECNQASIRADLTIAGEPYHLKPQIELTIYRAAQEGLNNVRKHSGANQVSVILDYHDKTRVRLEIADNGHGAQNSSSGYGLLGLRERTQLLGGKMSTESVPGTGFKLTVEVPN
jgi:signal transduction histidine kinase